MAASPLLNFAIETSNQTIMGSNLFEVFFSKNFFFHNSIGFDFYRAILTPTQYFYKAIWSFSLNWYLSLVAYPLCKAKMCLRDIHFCLHLEVFVYHKLKIMLNELNYQSCFHGLRVRLKTAIPKVPDSNLTQGK